MCPFDLIFVSFHVLHEPACFRHKLIFFLRFFFLIFFLPYFLVEILAKSRIKERTRCISVQVCPFDLIFVSFHVSHEPASFTHNLFFLSIFDPNLPYFLLKFWKVPDKCKNPLYLGPGVSISFHFCFFSPFT